MDLVGAREAPENPISVDITSRQFAQWMQMEPADSSDSQPIQLTSCDEALSWYQFFTTPGNFGPVLLALAVWIVGCVVYAFFATPQIPMLAPEIFYQQVQEQIRSIPVPDGSPHYEHYRHYYLQQYQEHLRQYRELEADFELHRGPRFHWGALRQGLGLGSWLFAALLAFCEYQYGTITSWIEIIEEWWIEWRRRPRAPRRDPLEDDAARESFLQEMLGNGSREVALG